MTFITVRESRERLYRDVEIILSTDARPDEPIFVPWATASLLSKSQCDCDTAVLLVT